MRLLALILLVFFSSEAQATITKLLKKRRVVVIDDSDVSKGDKVCFYSASGRKRACGQVVKVKEDKSYVKVKSRKRFRRLKKGMTHELSGSSGAGDASSGHSFAFRLLFTPGMMARSQFRYLNTNKTSGGSDGPFLALSGEVIKQSDSTMSRMARMLPWGSGGAEGEVFITPTISIAMGGRYTLVNASPRVIYDFLEKESREYLSSEYKSHELNFWLDFFLLHVADLNIRLALGGEFTMSSISITTMRMRKDGEAEVMIEDNAFAGKSTANIASVRLSARKNFPLGAYGLGLGITGIISPMAFGSSFKLDSKPGDTELFKEYGDNEEKMTADIEDALEHGNNLFSVVLGLSFYLGI